MKSAWARTFCRLLVVLMIWTPFQVAQAAMIGSDQVVTSSSSADRGAVLTADRSGANRQSEKGLMLGRAADCSAARRFGTFTPRER